MTKSDFQRVGDLLKSFYDNSQVNTLYQITCKKPQLSSFVCFLVSNKISVLSKHFLTNVTLEFACMGFNSVPLKFSFMVECFLTHLTNTFPTPFNMIFTVFISCKGLFAGGAFHLCQQAHIQVLPVGLCFLFPVLWLKVITKLSHNINIMPKTQILRIGYYNVHTLYIQERLH